MHTFGIITPKLWTYVTCFRIMVKHIIFIFLSPFIFICSFQFGLEKDQETKPASLLCYHQDQKQHQNKHYVVLDDAVVPVSLDIFLYLVTGAVTVSRGSSSWLKLLTRYFQKKPFWCSLPNVIFSSIFGSKLENSAIFFRKCSVLTLQLDHKE